MHDPETLAALHTAWSAVLDVEATSDEDNFFTSGGDSLGVVDLMERVEADLRIEFPLETVFLDGRFGAIAAECAKRRAATMTATATSTD
ncbi:MULTISPECIES: phosphopantetheine-binding protein [Kitasatospora]|uniref:Carrier domain-containing protein n=1 Tax=Kitasatospora setae (strain ATCC 33774 / DSM 43861 / JCM 3304 / KCC A-0304 / NBRC 14216 / KM-6054) TaxID=452652 RepID=E4N9P0_KITSK|nr:MULTISPECIES: phosphopantetheine-binding protein [Kitasatospora]BAJ27921.1 hypothetical protein KSE_20980 [Kitasatospora setae KM-6054]